MKKISAILVAAVAATLSLGAQKRVLYIGDSITDGNWGTNCNGERSTTDMNHIFGHGYMYLCASEYMAQGPKAGWQFFNRGISGNTVVDLERRWQTDALDLRPDVLSILVGINDVIGNNGIDVDLAQFEARYRGLLEQSRKQNPDLMIVIGEPFCEDGFRVDKEGFVRRNCEALSAVLRRVAEDFGAVYLPYQQMFDDLCAGGATEYWIWDGIHPTPAGHYRMAQMWMKAMNDKMSKL